MTKNEEDNQDEELNKQLIISEEKKEKEKRSRISSFSSSSQEIQIETLSEGNKYDKSIKIILLGDSNVGKSSIVNCLKKNENLQRKTLSLEVYNYIMKIKDLVLRMQIWDTVGQEKFDSIATNYYKTTDVAIFVYSINDLSSFENINHWYNELSKKGDTNIDSNDENSSSEKSMIKVLVGNKKDLEECRLVSYEQGEKLCKEKKFDLFMEIGNLGNEGIFNDSYCSNNEENENIDFKKKYNNDDNDEKNNVKSLFNKIGKIFYKQYMKNRNINSYCYEYEASSSILESKDYKKEKENKASKSCC
jgi:small GTP-binding protein